MADELIQLETRSAPGPTVDGVVDALERAYAFVEDRGSDLDRLRFHVLLEQETPEALQRYLLDFQDGEGLFRDLDAGCEGVAEPVAGRIAPTLRALSILDDHDLLRGPEVERCAAALSALQGEDGCWVESGQEEGHSLFLTGMCGAFLVKSACVRLPVIDAAVEALAAAWSQERVSALSWALLTSYYHLLTHVSHDVGDEAMAWCGRELDKGFRGGVVSALEVSRMFLFCGAYAVPGASVDGEALLTALLAAQREDGGFVPTPAHLGLATEGEATLSAVIALSRFGRGLPR